MCGILQRTVKVEVCMGVGGGSLIMWRMLVFLETHDLSEVKLVCHQSWTSLPEHTTVVIVKAETVFSCCIHSLIGHQKFR